MSFMDIPYGEYLADQLQKLAYCLQLIIFSLFQMKSEVSQISKTCFISLVTFIHDLLTWYKIVNRIALSYVDKILDF